MNFECLSAGLGRYSELVQQVESKGACSLPGVSINYDRFLLVLERAIFRGFVTPFVGEFVAAGLRWGFDLGVKTDELKGKIKFKNYPSAIEARRFVTKATRRRVEKGKTICLGAFEWAKDKFRLPWANLRVFPLGAVPKPLELDEMRPVSDHTRTGMKAATDMTFLRHTLSAYDDVACEHKFGYWMSVRDVDDAFPLLPLIPKLWPFFLFIWYSINGSDDDCSTKEYLFMHVNGDFGAAGLPGSFKLFFTDAVCGMARSEEVLTLPLVVYVDDLALCGPHRAEVNAEGARFDDFLLSLGIFIKVLKTKLAALRQLFLGFIWDSEMRTRTLEERKLLQYLDMLIDFTTRKSLSLREMQQVAGRLQRALLTMPPGAACFMANLFALMRGLSVPWQKRRTTAAVRQDFKVMYDLLGKNLGKGFFCFDHFKRAPDVFTDASKEARYAGGGYASKCGRYRFWHYVGRSMRNHIDYLEGDAVRVAMTDLGPHWSNCIVRFYIDNTAFQRSAVKSWSRAARLTHLLREIFALSIQYQFIGEYVWLSTHTNVYADALSRRNGEQRFLQDVAAGGFFDDGSDEPPLQRHPECGMAMFWGKEFSCSTDGDGPEDEGDDRWVASFDCWDHKEDGSPPDWACLCGWAWQCPNCLGTVCNGCFRGFKAVTDLPSCHCLFVSPLGSENNWHPAFGDANPRRYANTYFQERCELREAVDGEPAYDCVLCAADCGFSLVHPAHAGGMDDDDGDDDDDDADEDDGGHGDAPPAPHPDDWDLNHAGADSSSSEDELEVDAESGDDSDATQISFAFFWFALACGRIASVAFQDGVGMDASRFAMRLRGGGGMAASGALMQQLSVSYARASIFDGLPTDEVRGMVDTVMDNRLSASTMRSISAALVRWDETRSRYGWPRIIVSDDPERGGKLGTFVCDMLRDTTLVANSISNYVWAMRTWMKLQRQLDPAYGVIEWADFMSSVQVVAHVASEPRKEVPLSWVAGALSRVNRHVFWEVQAAHFMLVMLFTFARSESPVPKAFTGEGQFDPAVNWMVSDFEVRSATSDLPAHAAARMKVVKQDQLATRPSASGNEDWVLIGPANGDFDILMWTQLLFALHGGRRDPSGPFYMDPDRRRPLLYGKALSQVRELWARSVGAELAHTCGIHGLRVAGYNGGRAYDEELTVAHGGWRSLAHRRYQRFGMAQVLRLPAAIVRQESDDAPPESVDDEAAPPVERTVGQARSPHRRGMLRRAPPAVVPLPAAPVPPAVAPDATPLTGYAGDAGRRVMIPRHVWPSDACDEFEGRGWAAVVVRVSRRVATVRFSSARDADGRRFPDERLDVAVLEPV